MRFELENEHKIEKELKEMEKSKNKNIDEISELKLELPKKQKELEKLKEQKEKIENEFRDLSGQIRMKNEALIKKR